MRIPIYQVDAFTRRQFGGNPAAVCPLEAWLPDAALQAIAAENNLSETAFLVRRSPDGDRWELRWFTPAMEIDLCGHATLAAAHVVMRRLAPGLRRVVFDSRSGPLPVERREDGWLLLDFPAWPPSPGPAPAGLAEALGRAPAEVLRTRDLLAVYPRAEDVRALRPDFRALAGVDALGIIVTAPGPGGPHGPDFVSRFFAPAAGVDEDPVTGSAHCTLAPYWAARLGKSTLRAEQWSARGGELLCELRGDRVLIGGHVADYLEGTLTLEDAGASAT